MNATFPEALSLITPDRLENLRRALALVESVPGDMAEVGVYRGGSAIVIADAYPDRTLHLFDTFLGLPYAERSERDPKGLLKEGMFACSVKAVRRNLAGRNAVFHVGRLRQSVWESGFNSYAFVHVDCDLYDTAKEAILWFWPRMTTGGVMFFDDYGCDFTGVTEAVHEAFAPEQIVKQYAVGGEQIGCYVVK